MAIRGRWFGGIRPDAGESIRALRLMAPHDVASLVSTKTACKLPAAIVTMNVACGQAMTVIDQSVAACRPEKMAWNTLPAAGSN